jgi:hypothetical protein
LFNYSAANHRYTAHDYYLVDPLLGGNQARRQIALTAAHLRAQQVRQLGRPFDLAEFMNDLQASFNQLAAQPSRRN